MALYRSPSQSQGEFEKFANNLELNLETLFRWLYTMTNAKSKNWYFDDSTTSQGNVLDNITSHYSK